MKRTYIILGAGGMARETICHLKDFFYSMSSNAENFFNIVLVDDFTPLTKVQIGGLEYEVVKDWNFEKFDHIVGFLVGVGNPNLKKQMIDKATKAGLSAAPTLIHPRAIVQNGANTIGFGGVICPGVVITTNVVIGDYVIINYNSTVGHDAVISDYVTINPGCNLSGNIFIDKLTNIGAGSVIKEKIKIASGVITGAQSCVVKNIDKSDIVVTGVPAKELVR
jgi:sugar O-acyltransferase (sialic acid O-acetyltransferase NeuD family)